MGYTMAVTLIIGTAVMASVMLLRQFFKFQINPANMLSFIHYSLSIYFTRIYVSVSSMVLIHVYICMNFYICGLPVHNATMKTEMHVPQGFCNITYNNFDYKPRRKFEVGFQVVQSGPTYCQVVFKVVPLAFKWPLKWYHLLSSAH